MNTKIENNNVYTFEVTKGLEKVKIKDRLVTSNNILNQVLPSISVIEDFSHKYDDTAIYLRQEPATSSFFEAIFIS